MSLPPPLDIDRPIPKDPAEAVYSRRRMYALISASIRTSTNSGFIHAILCSPPFSMQRESTPHESSCQHIEICPQIPPTAAIFRAPVCPHAHANEVPVREGTDLRRRNRGLVSCPSFSVRWRL